MSLAACPPEIVSCVLANLQSPPTLCNLARCSRQLYLYVIPHLYRHIRIEEGVREEELRNGKLRKLASLLIRRPDLARLVRHFTLHKARPSHERAESSQGSDYSEASEYEDFKEIREPADPRDIEVDRAFETAVHAWTLSRAEEIEWLRELNFNDKHYQDPILALLLPALRKVEKLVLDLKISIYVKRVMRRAASRDSPFDVFPFNINPPFEALKSFACPHDLHAASPSFIASLLQLPSIQEISGGFGNTWRDYELDEIRVPNSSLVRLESSSSPLTSLDLSAYALSQSDLGYMLRAPKALRTFFYRLYFPAQIDFINLHHALGPLETSLERLSLDYHDDYENCHDMFMVPMLRSPEHLGLMPSFINFKALKVFKSAALFFAETDDGTDRHGRIDIFPPNLETLHVTRFQARFESLLVALENLLTQKSPPQIPSLKNIIPEEMDFNSGGPPKLTSVSPGGTKETAIGRFSRVAAAYGVSIELR